MSKATFLKSLFGEIAPKAAAPAAGASLMFPSDDAEAGVVGMIKSVDEAVAAMTKAVKSGRGQRDPAAIARDVMHSKKYANYDDMGDYAIKVDGDTAGPYWHEQVDSMAKQILDMDGLDPRVRASVMAWAKEHKARDLGWRPAPPKTTHAPKPQMPPNSAMGDALKLAMAGGAAGAAGGANAQDAGFPSYQSDDDQVLDHARYGSRSPGEAGFPAWGRYEIGPSHGLPTPTWGDIGNTTLEVLDKPMSGLQGLFRGLYGLATGESLVEAGAQAGHMMQGGSEEGFDRVGEGVESLMEPLDRQFPYLRLGKAAGDTTSLGLSLLSPF